MKHYYSQTDKRNVAQTVQHAETMAKFAWSRKTMKSNPWLNPDVQGFIRSMDRAGYVFEEHEYPVDGCFIESRWEQLAQWAESIAQNERDTARGI